MRAPVALLGSGEFLDGMAGLDRWLLTGRTPRVVHLPTAAGQEGTRRLRYWENLAKSHFEGRLGVSVETLPILDRRSANDPHLAERLDGAGLIYLSGGNPGYLADSLRDSRALTHIRGAAETGTAVAGCSAGAAALTEVAPDVRSGSHSGPGLALVPGVAIIPHYDAMRRWRRNLADRFVDGTPATVAVIGVDEDTAIVTEDHRTFEVYGAGTAVEVATGAVHHAGERFTV